MGKKMDMKAGREEGAKWGFGKMAITILCQAGVVVVVAYVLSLS
jgi:hypothetical protein